jgi:preprotein translocase subunit YajC
MMRLPLKKQICMEGGYMLSEIISLIIILVMMFSLCYVGYRVQQYKYHKRAKQWMREYRKNNKR